MKKPNIFNYATSELSQDAIICYILEWAKKDYKDIDYNLHKLGISFIDSLFKKCDITKPSKYNNIEIKKQYKNIDILCVVNNEYSIIIEDKTNTKNHSDQLKRYFNKIEKEYSETKILPIYFKTGDQSDYKSIEDDGYKIYSRQDFLNILKMIECSNDIIENYTYYLQNIEDSINSYKVIDIDNWTRDAWKGFFIELKEKLKDGNWDYVSNRSGGFIGFWWNWHSKEKEGTPYSIYLQLEFNKLVFKLECLNKNDRNNIRSIYREKLHNFAEKKKINIKNYGRTGRWMGVAILEDDYRITDNSGLIDIDKTVNNLKKIEELLELVANEL